jgi:drug/metabolite transporter (DMT)-like permease
MSKRFWYFVIGTCLAAIGISGVVLGKLPGIGTKGSPARYVTYTDNPVEYCFMLAFLLIFGGACLWAFFFEKEEGRGEE